MAAACSTACSTADRRSSGRRSRSTRPESSFESSSRFWASQSSRSSWARLVSRNSARAVGSSAAPSVRSSLNVRSAAIGVRSSCETSARNSRLRSRSRRMISMLSWSRSAIALNWRPSSDSSIGPSSIASDGTRRAKSPSARSRLASVSRRSGVVIRRVSMAATTTATASAMRPMIASSPVTFWIAAARYVYGFSSVTSTAYGMGADEFVSMIEALELGSRCWPGWGRARSIALNIPPLAGRNVEPSMRPSWNRTSALASWSAMIRCWLSFDSSVTTTSSTSPSSVIDGLAGPDRARVSRRS